MGTRHTPGPWMDCGFHDDGVDGERVIASPDGERMGYAVACVLPCGEPDMKPQLTLANARLIAAAPEMLEMLRSLDAWLSFRPDLTSREEHGKVKALIAKATGEQSCV